MQDGQEFFKLLLSHLEAKLQRSDSQVSHHQGKLVASSIPCM